MLPEWLADSGEHIGAMLELDYPYNRESNIDQSVDAEL